MKRLLALSICCLGATHCIGAGGDEVIEIDGEERVATSRIDGDSPFWASAPYLIEGPLACPIPESVAENPVPQAHESFTIENRGSATMLQIALEGASLDASLSAEPLLLVYFGREMPNNAADVADCLAMAKPGGGAAGTVTIALAAGESATAIVLEPEIGPGFDGSGSGTFRVRVTPQ